MAVAYVNQIENQLWQLEQACRKFRGKNRYADWVHLAVSRYILTGRASRDYEYAFVNIPVEELEAFVEKCLKGDLSVDGITETSKRILKCNHSSSTLS